MSLQPTRRSFLAAGIGLAAVPAAVGQPRAATAGRRPESLTTEWTADLELRARTRVETVLTDVEGVLVGGWTVGTDADEDPVPFVARPDTDGAIRWRTEIRPDTAEAFRGLVARSGGGTYVFVNEPTGLSAVPVEPDGTVGDRIRTGVGGATSQVASTADGGYAFAEPNSIAKLDADLDVEWQQTYSLVDRDAELTYVQPLESGVVGFATNEPDASFPLLGVGGSLDGTEQWLRSYNGVDCVTDLGSVAYEGDAIVVGCNADQKSALALRIGSGGTEKWRTTFSTGGAVEEFHRVQRSNEGSVLAVGSVVDEGNGWVVEIGPDGQEIGHWTVGRSDDGVRLRASGTLGDGYVVAGHRETGTDRQPGYLARLVQNTAPDPAFSVEPAEPAVGDPVTFDAAGTTDPDGNIAGFTWHVDGSLVGEGRTESYTFESGGEHTVSLTVRDRAGLSASAEQTVVVDGTTTDGGTTPWPTTTAWPTTDDGGSGGIPGFGLAAAVAALGAGAGTLARRIGTDEED